MDVDKALHELYEEKRRLDRAIVALEASQRALTGKSPKRTRRGRKGMGPQERLAVSKRMSAYWATRRAQKRQLLQGESAAQPAGVTKMAQQAAIA